MLTNSKCLINSCPLYCVFCGEPFRSRDGSVEFWRTSAGDHFCSEFCAEDGEEAHFRNRRAAPITTKITTATAKVVSRTETRRSSFVG